MDSENLNSMSCQLKNIHEMTEKNFWLNDLFQIRIKVIWTIKERLNSIKNKILSRNHEPIGPIKNSQIRSENWIKVRSEKEIKQTLDVNGSYRGCVFTPEMYQYCNKTFKVLKDIDYFYDEVKQKMCKTKNLVVLDSVICSGERKLFPNSCDRACFFFWHKNWLKKVV